MTKLLDRIFEFLLRLLWLAALAFGAIYLLWSTHSLGLKALYLTGAFVAVGILSGTFELLRERLVGIASGVSRVSSAASAGKFVEGRYALYLRPFQTDAALNMTFQISPGAGRTTTVGEFIAEECNRQHITLKQIGEDGSVFSRSHTAVISDAEWKSLATALIENADSLFIVPTSNKGTLWELEQVDGRELWGKVFLIMPIEIAPFSYVLKGSDATGYVRSDPTIALTQDYRALRESVLAALSHFGIEVSWNGPGFYSLQKGSRDTRIAARVDGTFPALMHTKPHE